MDIHEVYQNGEIYKVVGRLRYNSAGEVAFLYIKEVLEEQVSGTKLDKKRETYMAPIHLEDEILVNHMKYLFVNQDGSYTIGYEDGYVFGGHEIDVDVDENPKAYYFEQARNGVFARQAIISKALGLK